MSDINIKELLEISKDNKYFLIDNTPEMNHIFYLYMCEFIRYFKNGEDLQAMNVFRKMSEISIEKSPVLTVLYAEAWFEIGDYEDVKNTIYDSPFVELLWWDHDEYVNLFHFMFDINVESMVYISTDDLIKSRLYYLLIMSAYKTENLDILSETINAYQMYCEEHCFISLFDCYKLNAKLAFKKRHIDKTLCCSDLERYLEEKHYKDAEAAYLIGKCYLLCKDDPEKAIKYLKMTADDSVFSEKAAELLDVIDFKEVYVAYKEWEKELERQHREEKEALARAMKNSKENVFDSDFHLNDMSCVYGPDLDDYDSIEEYEALNGLD